MSHLWKKILVPEQCSLLEALAIIDVQAMRTVLVVSKNNHLLGVVTDGDIRRAILAGFDLKGPVSKIMNSQPKTVNSTTSREEVVSLMEQMEIFAVPIVDDGKLVGLHTLYEALGRPKYDNPVFLMAGGFGKRLRPLTDNCPKPMLKVGDKPLLETLILRFVKAGFHKFYISTHYLSEMIKDYFGDGSRWEIDITYVDEEIPLGTGGALGLLPEGVPALPMIVMNGDILTKVDFENLLRYHNEKAAHATMCVREYEFKVPYGVVESKDQLVSGMVEKPRYSYHINAGIYVLNPHVIMEAEKNKKIDMPTLLQNYVDSQKPVAVYPIREYWLDIGRMADYNQAQVDYRNLSM